MPDETMLAVRGRSIDGCQGVAIQLLSEGDWGRRHNILTSDPRPRSAASRPLALRSRPLPVFTDPAAQHQGPQWLIRVEDRQVACG
jgi:hypothetical protein